MDKLHKAIAIVGTVLAAVLGALAGMSQLPESWHKWVMVGLSVLSGLGFTVVKALAQGDKKVE